jgi:hypothetical protein
MLKKEPSKGGLGRILWLIPAALLIGNIATVVWQIQNGGWQERLNDVSFNVTGIAFALVGALIIARKPSQVIGWLLMGFPLLVISDQLALNHLLAHPPTPSPELSTLLVAWFSQADWWLLIGPLLLVLQLFPTGKPISKRWVWPGRVLLITFAYFALFLTFAFDLEVQSLHFVYPTPLHILPEGFTDFAFIIFGAALLGTVAASAASLIVRYRRAEPTQRAQLRWLMYAAVFFFVVYTYGFITEIWSSNSPLIIILFTASLLLIPVAIGVAILQYHLWDINVVINRTLVYGLLTALIAAIWAGSLTGIDQAIGSLVGDQSKAVSTVLSTLLAASIVQPARKRIEKWINRRFFPEKRQLETGFIEIEPEFWTYLDIDQVAQLVVQRVCAIMQAPRGAFMIRNPEGVYEPVASHGIELGKVEAWKPDRDDMKELQRERAAAWEESPHFHGYIPLFIPRVGPNEVLGLLALSKRKGGRGYSGDDLKALAALGGKIGKALYALELNKDTNSEALLTAAGL